MGDWIREKLEDVKYYAQQAPWVCLGMLLILLFWASVAELWAAGFATAQKVLFLQEVWPIVGLLGWPLGMALSAWYVVAFGLGTWKLISLLPRDKDDSH